MITRIQARNFLCFKEIEQSLDSFQVLVGPNGSGKSAFLDVIFFLGQVTSGKIEEALRSRATNFEELTWARSGGLIRLEVEAQRTEDQRVRYAITIGLDTRTDTVRIVDETVTSIGSGAADVVVSRIGNKAVFEEEARSAAQSPLEFHFPDSSSAFANLPLDISKYPSALWLRELLQDGLRIVFLERLPLRKPSPAWQGRSPLLDGSNLARMIAHLSADAPALFNDWFAHVRTALPDLTEIRTVARQEDKTRYIVLKFTNGVEVPSWMASDGTLRLLALTILAYIPDFTGIYLIDEPETGIHPSAIEAVYQSLSSVYGGQVLIASHSPILLNLANPGQLLCFSKTSEGTTITRGDKHPALQQWKGEVSLSDLFAAGVLG